MQILFIEILYDKVIWWIRSLSRCSVIADIPLKKYLIYYLDIILAICILIGYQIFALYIIFATVKYQLINNLDKNNMDNNKDKNIIIQKSANG